MLSGQYDRRQQQTDTDTVRVRGKGNFLDDQRTPRVEHDVPGRGQAQQQRNGRQIDKDQDRLQGYDTARVQPIAEQEDDLRDRSVDRRQFGIIDPIQDATKYHGNAGIAEERFRDGSVGRTGRGETIAVPQVTVEVVFVKRAARQPADTENHGPENQAAERERLATPVAVQVQAEDRQAGPCNEKKEHRQVGFAGLPRQ